MSKKIKIVCVVGPTASGKTALGIELAREFNGEVISADSMQLYKGIHIASAAPDCQEMCGIKHHLIEVLELGTACTVADYVDMARQAIEDVHSRGKLPVIVGGTGLYINSLVDGIKFIEQDTDIELRQRLTEEFESLGGEEMLSRLSVIDKDAAEQLHPNDKRRIIRAFEIYYSTGSTKTQANEASKTDSPYDALVIGIQYEDRGKLYERINKRVDIMLDNGLLQEAQSTFSKELGGAGQAIGHKELYAFLENEITLEQAVENLKQATRRYAKRQLTWFRRSDSINWVYADDGTDPYTQAKAIVRKWSEQH